MIPALRMGQRWKSLFKIRMITLFSDVKEYFRLPVFPAEWMLSWKNLRICLPVLSVTGNLPVWRTFYLISGEVFRSGSNTEIPSTGIQGIYAVVIYLQGLVWLHSMIRSRSRWMELPDGISSKYTNWRAILSNTPRRVGQQNRSCSTETLLLMGAISDHANVSLRNEPEYLSWGDRVGQTTSAGCMRYCIWLNRWSASPVIFILIAAGNGRQAKDRRYGQCSVFCASSSVLLRICLWWPDVCICVAALACLK